MWGWGNHTSVGIRRWACLTPAALSSDQESVVPSGAAWPALQWERILRGFVLATSGGPRDLTLSYGRINRYMLLLGSIKIACQSPD